MDIRERLRQYAEGRSFLGVQETREAWELVLRLEVDLCCARADRDRAQAEAATLRAALEDARADLTAERVRRKETVVLWTQAAAERDETRKRVLNLKDRADRLESERDAALVRGDSLAAELEAERAKPKADTHPGDSPRFGCYIPGVPSRVVYVASEAVREGDVVYVDARTRVPVEVENGLVLEENEIAWSLSGLHKALVLAGKREHLTAVCPASARALERYVLMAGLAHEQAREVRALKAERDRWAARNAELEARLQAVRDAAR